MELKLIVIAIRAAYAADSPKRKSASTAPSIVHISW